MAIEEFTNSGLMGFILVPNGKKKWGWCGFVEGLQYLLFSYFSMKRAPLALVLGPSESQSVPVNRSFAQVVAIHGGLTTSNDRDVDRAFVVAHRNVWPFRRKVQQCNHLVLPMPLFLPMLESCKQKTIRARRREHCIFLRGGYTKPK